MAWLTAAPAANRATAQTDDDVNALVAGLIENIKSAQITDAGPTCGSFAGERTDVHAGGVTALATYALLAAGVSVHDSVTRRAVDYLAEHPLPGTYSRSLRAAVWAHLATRTGDTTLRQRYQRALREDASWLVKAMRDDGFYGYDLEGTGGDHSCSQFGVLGVWAAQGASVAVPSDYWERVSRHWLDHQGGDGSWSYRGGERGTATMTTGGINTLYVTLAQHFAKGEPAYSPLRGVPSRGQAEDDVNKTLEAAEHGFEWLANHDILEGGPYQLFGLERLGVAAGRKFIGGKDWYRAGAASIKAGSPNVINDSFSLLFLTYGRAPVLISKMRYGQGHGWNTYYRDLYFLTLHLSALHERIYKWQIVSADSTLHDLLDAPMLLISGAEVITLTKTQRDRLRDYVDAGGTIVGHADRGSVRFAESFRRLFGEMFEERGWQVQPLPADHAVYSAAYGRDDPTWAEPFRTEGIDDGLRTCVFLFPVDIAGAWHQDRAKQHRTMFDIMANLTAYAAGEYSRLPSRLRPPELAGVPARPRGYLIVESRSVGATLLQPSGRWHWMGRQLAFERGLLLVNTCDSPTVESRAVRPDIVHITGRGEFGSSSIDQERLLDYVRAGGFVWFESAGTDAAFSKAAQAAMNGLAEALGASVAPASAEHPVFTGRTPGGTAPGEFRPNRWARGGLSSERPKVYGVEHAGRTVALFTPFDVLATAAGHRLYNVAAYGRDQSAALLKNLLLWRYARVTGDSHASTSSRLISERSPAALLTAAQAYVDAEAYTQAASTIRTIELLQPLGSEIRRVRAALRDRLLSAFRAARRESRPEDARRLAKLLVEFFPDDAESAEVVGTIEQASTQDEPSETTDAAELPIELSTIVVMLGDHTTDARTLLATWFDLEKQLAEVEKELESYQTQWEALDERARELIRRRASRDRGRSDRSRGGPEFDEIAAEREVIEGKAKRAGGKAKGLVARMNQITAALEPSAKVIAGCGIELRNGRWIRKQ